VPVAAIGELGVHADVIRVGIQTDTEVTGGGNGPLVLMLGDLAVMVVAQADLEVAADLNDVAGPEVVDGAHRTSRSITAASGASEGTDGASAAICSGGMPASRAMTRAS